MRYACAVVAFATAGCAYAAPAGDDETLFVRANYQCARGEACFVADTEDLCAGRSAPADCLSERRVNYDPKTGTLTVNEELPNDILGFAIIEVRLKFEGGAERAANLELAVSATPCADAGNIAFLGFSRAGNIILDTEKGVSELISPEIHLAHPDARVLIDPSTGKIFDRLPAPHDNGSLFGFQFDSRQAIYYFDKEKCVTAPRNGAGPMKNAAKGCAPLSPSNKWKNDRGLRKATAEELNIAKRTLPKSAELFGEYFNEKVTAIASDGTIVVDLIDACS